MARLNRALTTGHHRSRRRGFSAGGGEEAALIHPIVRGFPSVRPPFRGYPCCEGERTPGGSRLVPLCPPVRRGECQHARRRLLLLHRGRDPLAVRLWSGPL